MVTYISHSSPILVDPQSPDPSKTAGNLCWKKAPGPAPQLSNPYKTPNAKTPRYIKFAVFLFYGFLKLLLLFSQKLFYYWMISCLRA